MRKVTSCASVAAFVLAFAAGAAFGQATIQVGSVEGSGTVDVTLATGGNDVAGTENDITFGPEVQVSNCAVNPDIMREASAFSFSPSGCTEGVDCESVKALVLSFSNLDPLADGVVLYSCDVTVAGGTEPGDYTLGCANPGASDPTGMSVDADCADGTVTVPDVPVAEIVVGDAEGVQGGTVSIDVSLNLLDETAEVAASENVLTFPEEARIVDCAANPEINREASAFSFQPTGCDDGGSSVGCESIKALILSFSNLDPLPDGTVLYSCDIALAGGTAAATLSGATGAFTIGCEEPGTSDPAGAPLTTICSDGTVTILAPPTVTPTPTIPPPTDTPEEPTDTPTPEEPTDTPTPDQPDTPTPGDGFDFDDDSCAIVAPQASSSGWMLLLPMAALLWLRRRR